MAVRYGLPGFLDTWTVTEADVPEAAWHAAVLRYLEAVLLHWVARTGADAAVFRNLAVRVREDRPTVGFDPDLCLVAPAPPESKRLSSLCLWKPGHTPPALSIEVVSPGHPTKDYIDIPARCAAAGVAELWVFDPELAGPHAPSGPHRLQLFSRTEDGALTRVHAGDGPARSPLLGVFCIPQDGRLTLADDPAGHDLWLTAEEHERHEAERLQLENQAALRRIADLEAQLARRDP